MPFKRLKDSFVFRIASFYKKALKIYPPILSTRKDTQNLNVVMLCGLNQLDLLQESIFSLCNQFNRLPSIYIFTDKDLDIELCEKRLSWIPGKIAVYDAKSCIKYHRDNGNDLLASFAERNPMGLKMAAILQVVDKNETVLYCDTDVLWFKDPQYIISKIISDQRVSMALSQDFQPSYDNHLVEEGNLKVLLDEPFYCAGIMILKSLSTMDRIRLNELLKIGITKSNHFTEQTMFAYLNKINGNTRLDIDQFCITVSDQFHILPKKRNLQVARHYIGAVRHQFWRDAFFARFNYFKN